MKIEPCIITFDKVKKEIDPKWYKTIFVVVENKKDIIIRMNCGFFSFNTEYASRDAGYYVIPCYLKLGFYELKPTPMLFMRRFKYLFGEPRTYEPQDIPRGLWYKCNDFKNYQTYLESSLCKYGISAYEVEMYDNMDEAIERAKILDKRLKAECKYNDLLSKLKWLKGTRSNLLDKIVKLNHGRVTERKKLEKQLAKLTIERKDKAIKIKLRELEKNLSVLNEIMPYNS